MPIQVIITWSAYFTVLLKWLKANLKVIFFGYKLHHNFSSMVIAQSILCIFSTVQTQFIVMFHFLLSPFLLISKLAYVLVFFLYIIAWCSLLCFFMGDLELEHHQAIEDSLTLNFTGLFYLIRFTFSLEVLHASVYHATF